MRKLSFLLVLLALLTVAVVAAAIAYFRWEDSKYKKMKLDAGLSLMHPDFTVTPERRKLLSDAFEVPPALQRDEIIEFLLVPLAEGSDEYRGAYLFLGEYFLASDCTKAAGFLEEYLGHKSDDTEVREVLEVARTSGCQDAIELRRKQTGAMAGD